jgi:hypothetical protein
VAVDTELALEIRASGECVNLKSHS